MKSKLSINIVIICATIVLLALTGAFIYIKTIDSRNADQARKQRIFTDCMERTKTESVGYEGKKWINKDGDEPYCRKQMKEGL
jgi:hypothetical protein